MSVICSASSLIRYRVRGDEISSERRREKKEKKRKGRVPLQSKNVVNHHHHHLNLSRDPDSRGSPFDELITKVGSVEEVLLPLSNA